jgi:hypothetical protein
MPEAPPLVSCNSHRSSMPKRQAMSLALSGSMENEEIARPSTSASLRPASLSAITTASRRNVWVFWPGSGWRA